MENRPSRGFSAILKVLRRGAWLASLAACVHVPHSPRSAPDPEVSPNSRSLSVYVAGPRGLTVLAFHALTGRSMPQNVQPYGGGYAAVSPSGRHVYVSEAKPDKGVIHAFSRNPNSGALTWLGTSDSGGMNPTHLSVDPTGRFVLVANFRSDNVTVFPIQADGRLNLAAATVATGHRPHQVTFAVDGRYVFVPHRDDNTLGRYRFNADTGALLELADGPLPRLPTETRPRHIAVHPSNRAAYLVHEGEVTLVSYALDPQTGQLTNPQPAPTRHGGGAHVVVSPDGRFVYVSARGPMATIYVYAVDPISLRLAQVQAFSEPNIAGPRDFDIDPSGRFLLLGSQDHETVVSLALDVGKGTINGISQTLKTSSGATFVGIAHTGSASQGPISLLGAIDLHCHTAPDIVPRDLSDAQLAQMASDEGMRAVVLKSHVTSTADRAEAVMLARPQLDVFGGVVLNQAVGGINPQAVARMTTMQGGRGRMVWLPTFDVDRVSVLSQSKPTPELGQVLAWVAAHDLALATGHLSPHDALLVVKAARAAGVKRLLVSHALSPPVAASIRQMRALAEQGALIELVRLPHVFAETGSQLLRIEETAAAIQAIGARHFVLSSDLGRAGYGRPPDGLRALIRGLMAQGIAEADIQTMTRFNPAWILGLPSPPQTSALPESQPPDHQNSRR